MINLVRFGSIIIFGIIFPVTMLVQAHDSISQLDDDVAYEATLDDIKATAQHAADSGWGANDYALLSLLYLEHANQKTMVNKQLMKTAIVNIGFAVISVGLMFLTLGIETGSGVDASASLTDIQFNIKTGSTGVAVFLVGAIMATLGGVLRNNYQTSKIPDYERVVNTKATVQWRESLNAYNACKTKGTKFHSCFTQIFFQINQEELE